MLELFNRWKFISVCELVYKTEARVNHLACRSIKNLYEIARRSIEKNWDLCVEQSVWAIKI